jgi:hypothetical protein
VYRVYLYPILFGIFVPLSLYIRNSSEVMASETLAPLLIILIINLLLVSIAQFLRANLDRVGIALSLFWIVFFQFGELQNLAVPFGITPKALAVLVLMFILAITILIWKIKEDLIPAFSYWFFLTGVFIVIYPIFLFITNLFQESYAISSRPQTHTESIPTPNSRSGVSADIFYVLLDGYGGEEVLSRYFQFDNEPFYQMLEERGFTVIRKSRTNYSSTIHSLASSFNMDYLDFLVSKYGETFLNKIPIIESIYNSRLIQQLKQEDYAVTMVLSSSHLFPKTTKGLVDNIESYMKTSQFGLALLGNTPLGTLKLKRLRKSFFEFDIDRKPWVPDSLEWVFRQGLKFANNDRKDFVFLHVLSPHEPYYFDQNCKLVLEYKSQHWDGYNGPFETYRKAYLGQLLCINKMVKKFLDDLQAQTSQMPIVVLQGDHGPPEIEESVLEQNGFDKVVFRSSILNALLVPESVRVLTTDGMTPVNNFRLILSHVLGTHIEKLADHSFQSGYEKPYKFVEWRSSAAKN